MIEIDQTVAMRCRSSDVLDLVLDIERYATVDRKIHPVLWSRRQGDVVTFACRPRLGGLPQPRVVQTVSRVSPARIEIALAGPPANRLARLLADFHASFEVADAGAGMTSVRRRLRFDFRGPGRLVEPVLRRRLPAEVAAELALATAYLEGVSG